MRRRGYVDTANLRSHTPNREDTPTNVPSMRSAIMPLTFGNETPNEAGEERVLFYESDPCYY